MRCFYAQHVFPLNILIPECVEYKFKYNTLPTDIKNRSLFLFLMHLNRICLRSALCLQGMQKENFLYFILKRISC